MRLHQRSLLRTVAAGIVMCMMFGATACFGHDSPDERPTASASTSEQTSPITVVASGQSMGLPCGADRRNLCEGDFHSELDLRGRP